LFAGHFIRRAKASHRKLDLTVRQLSPLFHNRHVPALRTLIWNFTSLEPSVMQRQNESKVRLTRRPADRLKFEPAAIILRGTSADSGAPFSAILQRGLIGGRPCLQ
jgi:hypothetical protein